MLTSVPHVLILVVGLAEAVVGVSLVAMWTSLNNMYVLAGFLIFTAFTVIFAAAGMGLRGLGVGHGGVVDVKMWWWFVMGGMELTWLG